MNKCDNCSCVNCMGPIPGSGYTLCPDCGGYVGDGMMHSCSAHNKALDDVVQSLTDALSELEGFEKLPQDE